MAYCTPAEVRDVLGKTQADDVLLTVLSEVATEFVTAWTGRLFEAVTESKTYSGNGTPTLVVDDLLSVTSVTIDGTSYSPSDFVLEPFNKYPKRLLRRKNGLTFPETEYGNVAVEGSWGFSQTVPSLVRLATALIAAAVFETGRGAAAMTVKGQTVERAKDNKHFLIALQLLEPYREVLANATD